MKLLWISRLGYPCSYSYVSETFIPSLISHYDLSVFCTGIVHDKENHQRIASQFNLPLSKVFVIDKRLINSNRPEDHEYFNNYFNGIYHLKDVILQVKPSIIISLDDNVALERQWELIRTTSWDFEFKFIPYMTVDMSHIPKIFGSNPIKKMLTMTNFGKEELYKVSPTIQVDIIPHIVDHNIFYPLPNKKDLQLKWLHTNTKFVIGAFNANNNRKRWDILLHSFAKFAKQHDDVILLLKTPYLKPKNTFGITSCEEYDFEQLINEICDSSKIEIITGEYNNADLNELYNCCDLSLTTTSGEGWGLIPCEMALCKVPQLMPAWSSFLEIFLQSEGLIPVKEYTSYVGRKYKKLPETLQNEFIVIAKSYVFYQSTTLNIGEIGLTQGIPTICISPHGNNPSYVLHGSFELVRHFTRIIDAITFLQEYQYPDRFQILLGLDLDFLKKEALYLEKLYEILPKEHRINYLLSLETTKRYWDLSKGSVGLVSVDDTVDKLDKFYQSSDLREKEAEYQYQRIRSMCDPNVVSEKLLKYLQV
jgi:glycosyltransferase involved in cell wall biosynthesis